MSCKRTNYACPKRVCVYLRQCFNCFRIVYHTVYHPPRKMGSCLTGTVLCSVIVRMTLYHGSLFERVNEHYTTRSYRCEVGTSTPFGVVKLGIELIRCSHRLPAALATASRTFSFPIEYVPTRKRVLGSFFSSIRTKFPACASTYIRGMRKNMC